MTNKEIFDAIEQLQYVIDYHAVSGIYKFDNEKDIKVLESVYNYITKRQYIKFNAGCSSCVKEAFIILQNWQKRQEKNKAEEVEKLNNQLVIDSANATDETVDTVIDQYNADLANAVEFTPEVAEQAIAEPIEEEPKPIKTTKSNGRKRK